MEFIQPNDFLEIRLASVLTDYDRRILCELYQPLIGHHALAMFFTLWAEYERKDYLDTLSHDHLFSMMQITASELLSARRILEAIGLLRTYIKEEKGIKIYCYELFSPKYPSEFFADPLFSGMLTKYLGEKEASRLANSFKKGSRNKEYQEISCHFHDVFKLDYDDQCFSNGLKDLKTKKRIAGDVVSEFDFAVFFNKLEDKHLIKRTVVDEASSQEIERLSLLYGVDEEDMVECFIQAYNPKANKNERLDYHRLNSLVRETAKYPVFSKSQKRGGANIPTSNSITAQKIKLMEQVSCFDYLKYKQKNTSPASADLNLVNDLSSKFGLTIGVINALVDYVLAVKDNSLQRAYTEKIAASLAREGITSALDAMNFLLKFNRALKTKSSASKLTEDNGKKETMSEADNDEEYQKLLAEFKM